MKKMMMLALAVTAVSMMSGCAGWRSCASTRPPMTPSYCAPVYSNGFIPCAPVTNVLPPTKCK